MNKLNRIKIILIILISLSVIFALSGGVYAVDNNPFTTLANSNSGSGTQTESDDIDDDEDFVEALPAQNQNSNANNTNAGNTNKADDLITSNNTANLNNANVNRNVSNTEALAKTGLTDSNGFVAFIVVLCGISAVYSFKKIQEYKKI